MRSLGVKASSAATAFHVCCRCRQRTKRYEAQCPHCRQWDTLRPENGESDRATAANAVPTLLSAFEGSGGARLPSGLLGFDRVLGGGFVAGQSVILFGPPGMGKSTLALQVAVGCAQRARRRALYLSGEETGAQVLGRARRLQLDPAWILFQNPADVQTALGLLSHDPPAIVVVDSLQTLNDSRGYGEDEARTFRAFNKLRLALQAARVPWLLLSQVNARGSIKGGPRYPHLCDVEVELTGEELGPTRILFARKNRMAALTKVSLTMGGMGLI